MMSGIKERKKAKGKGLSIKSRVRDKDAHCSFCGRGRKMRSVAIPEALRVKSQEGELFSDSDLFEAFSEGISLSSELGGDISQEVAEKRYRYFLLKKRSVMRGKFQSDSSDWDSDEGDYQALKSLEKEEEEEKVTDALDDLYSIYSDEYGP